MANLYKNRVPKNLYEIKNHKGVHLCYQVAENEKDAVETARIFYGYKSAKTATFIRENSLA